MTVTAAARRTTRRSRIEPEPLPAPGHAPSATVAVDPESAYDRDYPLGRGTELTQAQEPMLIGLSTRDRDAINCPVCGRRIGPSVTRCPGCTTRLLLGVHLKRASVFVGIGIAAGLLIGGTLTAMVATGLRPAPPVVVAGGIVTPTASPVATTAPTVSPSAVAVTTANANALHQSADLTARLTSRAAALRALIRARSLDTPAVARVLRATATDAANGATIAPRLANWPAAAELSTELTAFYAEAAAIAREGLRASLAYPEAYRDSGRRMLTLFDRLAAIDALTQTVATDTGVALRP
jgi:hypothetical protein